ncbi:MAG: hypothetical protein WC877_01110 [Dehalococcoidales bacterium]|jgi:hypothetical protein
MRCGQECPCCSGNEAGEFCELQAGFDEVTTFPELMNYYVRGGYYIGWGYYFGYEDWYYLGLYYNQFVDIYYGDPCHLNIVKYLLWYGL